MMGWIIPPPKISEKTNQILLDERKRKIEWLKDKGFIRTEIIEKAMLKIPREVFIPVKYRDYAYQELPFPLPGKNATISCPHSYPMFYEAIELSTGDNLLEVGTGSGYGAVLAAEIVGLSGRVTTVEIDQDTFTYAEKRIVKFGYSNLFLIRGDGGKGYLPHAPYDKICLTAACHEIPSPLVNQLKPGGKLIAPCEAGQNSQDLILLKKNKTGRISKESIEKVLYVSLRGEYGI
ncbi:MAG: protein-L-isoaspartate O-methyltransferase [Candidatus Hodarchaeota archaeon]